MTEVTTQNRVAELMELYGITSQRQLAQIVGVSQGAVFKWLHNLTRPPVELADWAGVSYDWLIGRSPNIWSYDMIVLRRSLREKFARTNLRAVAPSTRFRAVVKWVLEQGTVVTKQTLSMFLRIDELTLDMILDGKLSAEWSTILRLSEYLDIPPEWFEDGSPRHLRKDRYDVVIQRLIEERIEPDDVLKIIDAIVAARNRSI